MKATRIILFVFIVIACTKEKENDNYKSVGTILGYDMTLCGCCGGWIINIEDVSYLTDTIPDDSSINLQNEKFPITVKLDWQMNDKGCLNKITVQRIKKI